MTPEMSEGLALTMVGLAIVFAVLILIAVVVALVRRADAAWQEREKAHEIAMLKRKPAIDNATAVVIAAAAAAYLVGRHRIRSVRRLLPPDAPSSPWSAQGRAVLQGSHRIIRKGR